MNAPDFPQMLRDCDKAANLELVCDAVKSLTLDDDATAELLRAVIVAHSGNYITEIDNLLGIIQYSLQQEREARNMDRFRAELQERLKSPYF